MALTYAAALERLGRKVSLQIDKKRGTTIVRKANGDVVIRHHGDPIVTIHPDQTYTLRTGAQATAVKRKRIAEYSPVSMIVKKGGLWAVRSTGERMPFLEGMRVDLKGRPLDQASLQAGLVGGREANALPESDTVKLQRFIKRTVVETLHELGIAAAGETVTGRPVRAVSFRAQARQLGDGSGSDPMMVLLPVLEQMMLSAGADPKKAKQAVTDARGAFYRGRTPTTMAAEMPGVEYRTPSPRPVLMTDHETTEDVMNEAAICAKCKMPIIAHFDNANRRRGCDYAMAHPQDLRTIEP